MAKDRKKTPQGTPRTAVPKVPPPSKGAVIALRVLLILGVVGYLAWKHRPKPKVVPVATASSTQPPAVALGGPVQAYPGQDFNFTIGGIKTKRGFTGWGAKPLKDQSITGVELKIKDKVYAHGIGTQAPSEIVLALDGKVSRFSCLAGVDVQAGNVGSLSFLVMADDKKLYASPVMTMNDAPVPISVDVRGAKELRLIVDPNGANDWDQADWVDLKFQK